MNNQDHLSILFLSCDKYSDLWKPLLYSFNKHWKHCPYPLYFGSNTLRSSNKRIKTLLSGPDKDWSTSFLRILQEVPTPYIFLWLDDIFPIEQISGADFSRTVAFMHRVKAKHIHVQPIPAPDAQVEHGMYGVYHRGAPYRVTTFGFWEVFALKELLIAGENPWNFEIMGSYRSSYTDGYYCTMKNLIPRVHMVEKGKYFREAYDYCLKHEIPVDTSKRGILQNGHLIKSVLQKYFFNIMIRVPWRLRQSVMNVARKLLISY